MIETEKYNKLKAMLSKSLSNLKDTATVASDQFEENESAIGVSNYLEDIAVNVNELTQVIGLLGYFELLEEGTDPLA